MCSSSVSAKAKNNVIPAKKQRSLKRLISFQKKMMSQPKTHQLLICPQENSSFPTKSQNFPFQSFLLHPTSPMFISQLKRHLNYTQIRLSFLKPTADLPQPAAHLPQPVQDDVLTKENFLEIMENFKDDTFNQLRNILKQP